MNSNEIPPETRRLAQFAFNEADKASRMVKSALDNSALKGILPEVPRLAQYAINEARQVRCVERALGPLARIEIPPEMPRSLQQGINELEKVQKMVEARPTDVGRMVPIETEREYDDESGLANLEEMIRGILGAGSSDQTAPANNSARNEAPAPTDTADAHETAMVHSPDFSTVRWGQETFTFTVRQAACVCVMWELFHDGTPFLKWDYILVNAADKYREKTGLDSKQLNGLKNCPRMRDVFKNHEAWGTMILRRGRDLFGLVAPRR